MSVSKSLTKSQEGGNTITPSSRSRKWTLTVNNPTSEDMSLVSRLSQRSEDWIIGEEVGDEGTPHLQCFFRFKNQVRFSTVKAAVPRGHWEKARGSVQENYRYCSKDGKFTTNIVPAVRREDLINLVLDSYKDVTWKAWQREVLDILAEPADTRTIHWIHEPTGNVGKSFLAKFLACKPGTILSSGKATDVFNAVNTTIEKGSPPAIVVCDIPRVCQDYVSYQCLEKLKDGCLYSGKYEGGLCIFPEVHVVCFSNARPVKEKMSLDRWKIYKIQDDALFLCL